MEKSYQIKMIDVLYYDGKIIPVQLTTIKGKKYINFIGKKVKLAVAEMHNTLETYNEGAQSIIMLKTVNGETRYAELGSFTAALVNSKNKFLAKYSKLYKFKDVVNSKTNTDDLSPNIVGEYFDTELSLEEIKDIFKELNKKPKKEKEIEK